MSVNLSPQAANVFPLRQAPGGPEQAPDLPIRGFVDVLDATRGLSGWVADAATGLPVSVAIWFDDEEAVSVTATQPRPDIWKDKSAERPTGFLFELDDLLKLAARTDISPVATLRVRIHQSEAWLPAAANWTFADVQVLRAPPLEVSHVEGQSGPLEPELRRLARQAFRQLSQPLRPNPQKQAGVVEYAVRLTNSLLLVGGWMQASLPALCALIVAAPGFKRAASMSVVGSPRADLPANARAFAGLLFVEDGIEVSDLGEQTRLFFAGQSLDWLAPISALRRPSLGAAMAEADALFELVGSAPCRDIRYLIRDSLPWEPKAQKSVALGAKVGIDSCFIAPGFGMFIGGWLLHAMSRPVNVRAKLGGAFFALDPSSLSLSPRHDLGSAFPTLADRTALAGFSCLLRGDADPDCLEPWLLRFEFGDGTVHLHELAPETTRRVDPEFDFNRLSTVAPGFEWAPWLAELVAAVGAKNQRDAAEGLQWLSCSSISHALVCALPGNIAHQRIALDALRRALGRLRHPNAGLVVLLPASLAPGLWASWEALLRMDGSTLPIAAARLLPGADVWSALPAVLAACEVKRFAFVGPSVLVTAEGMVAANEFLERQDSALQYLNVQSLQGDHEVLSFDANAFCWSAFALSEHRDEAPPLLPGLWRLQGLPMASSSHPAADAVAHGLRLAAVPLDPLRDQINTRLLSGGRPPEPARSRPELAAPSDTP